MKKPIITQNRSALVKHTQNTKKALQHLDQAKKIVSKYVEVDTPKFVKLGFQEYLYQELKKNGRFDNVSMAKAFDFIEVDLDKPLIQLKKEFEKKLRGKIKGVEVALSIASGSGKEHMALQSALLSLPVGVRFTALTKEGVVFL